MYYWPWLDPCSKGKRLANRGCVQLFRLNIFLLTYNLFLICSSGELKRGSLNRMYCFTCQVLTRRGLLTVFIFFRLGGHKVNSVLKWFQNYQIVFKACYSTVYLVYSPVCKFAVCICCTLFLTSWWAKQFVSFRCCIDYLACLTMFCITKFQ